MSWEVRTKCVGVNIIYLSRSKKTKNSKMGPLFYILKFLSEIKAFKQFLGLLWFFSSYLMLNLALLEFNDWIMCVQHGELFTCLNQNIISVESAQSASCLANENAYFIPVGWPLVNYIWQNHKCKGRKKKEERSKIFSDRKKSKENTDLEMKK